MAPLNYVEPHNCPVARLLHMCWTVLQDVNIYMPARSCQLDLLFEMVEASKAFWESNSLFP